MSYFSCFVASSIIFTVVLDQVLNLSPSTNMYPHVGRFSARVEMCEVAKRCRARMWNVVTVYTRAVRGRVGR